MLLHMATDNGSIRCELELGPDDGITITLFDGCRLPEAVDLCQIVVGRDEVTRQILVRQSHSG